MSFDFIAPHYHCLESLAFGNKLQAARTAFLDRIEVPKRVLIAGEGNGRFLRALLDKRPGIMVDCVDASARMLQLAREHVGGESRVRFLHEDVMVGAREKNTYDLVVTHFFLDCFNQRQLEKIVASIAKSATQNAIWLLADFSIPSGSLQKWHAQAWLWAMHRFFRAFAQINAQKLTDPSSFLSANGFCLEQTKRWRLGLVKSEVWRRM